MRWSTWKGLGKQFLPLRTHFLNRSYERPSRRGARGELLFGCVGRVVCPMHASGSHLKKCLPFPWINEQLGRTGQGGAICKCHRHCLLILHIIKANIPNLYQSNQEQAITATGAPGEPRPNSERREQGGRERRSTLFIYLTHKHTRSDTRLAHLPTINKHMKSAPTALP